MILFSCAWAADPNPWSMSVADDLEIRYWIRDERLPDPSDRPVFNYVEQVNRLNLNLSKGRWGLRAQVDQVALFANRYYLDDVLQIERSLLSQEIQSPFGKGADVYANVEKVALTYDGPGLQVQVGDFYAAFGRGVALNLNRNVDIDIDTSIQGLKLVAKPGNWDLTAIFGQLNRQQVFQDNPNLDLRGDLRHTVVALRAERFGLGPANIGFHGVSYDFANDIGLKGGFQNDGGPDVLIGGANVELMGVAGIDWYVEGNLFHYPTARLTGGEVDNGGALYGSATFYPGNTVWLVEGKLYRNTNQVNAVLAPELYQVAIAPTLEYERAITEDSAAAIGSEDIYGGRVQVDVPVVPQKFVPYVALAVLRDHDVTGLHFNDVPETIFHPMVGFDWLPGKGAALVNLGYRRDQRDGREAKADQQFHGDLTLNFPLFLGLVGNINVGAEHFRWGVNELQQGNYVETETATTITRGPIAFTWFTDYSSNPLINSVGNVSEEVYVAGELQVKPTSSLTIKAFYGAYKSGIRCSGGQCRQLPGFEGARASVTGNF